MTIRILTNIGEIFYDKWGFSGGERHVRLKVDRVPFFNSVTLIAYIYNSDDVMDLLLITDAIRPYYLTRDFPIHLEMPYLPYARQDRVCEQGEALSLRVMCNLINSQNYESVYVWDAHSDVAGALLDRVVVLPAKRFVQKIPNIRYTILVAPDAGALKKVYDCASEYGNSVAHATKHRDPRTGEITETTISQNINLALADVLIIDDICDGGRTFIELGKIIREQKPRTLQLYVTHGIFSKGTEPLKDIFDHVWVAHLWPNVARENFISVIGN